MAGKTAGNVRIGISGWRYEPWRGVFYPEKLRQKDELAYASTKFPTIEINGTFYWRRGHFARGRSALTRLWRKCYTRRRRENGAMGTKPHERQNSGDMMDFQTAVKTCFANYITFRGRAPRSEYWYFVLFLLIGGVITGMLDAILFSGNVVSPLNSIFSLVTIIPSLAVASRRLHDVDKSGWWQLLWIVPIIGWVVMIVWLVKRGTPGANNFGADPLGSMVAMPA